MASLNNPYSSYLYEPVSSLGEGDIMPRDYLSNSSGWLGNSSSAAPLRSFGKASAPNAGGNSETTLKLGTYPYPQTKIIPFGGKLFVLFVDDPGTGSRDALNRAQLFYTIFDGSTWSQPAAVDTDKTWDEAPDAFVIDDKILVTWADAGREFTSGDTAESTLSSMNISARWFDMNSAAFGGDEFAITQNTNVDQYADINPHISFDPETKRLLVYYTKIDYSDNWTYNSTPSNDPDAHKNTTDDGENSTVYGDIVNGYNVIAYRYAEKQADDTFAWNTTYDAGEGYNPDQGFTPEGFYGQRFLDLSVLVDIAETPVMQDTPNPIGDLPAGATGKTVGTQQVVTEAANANLDPLVADSNLITYNGLALYTYVLDNDSSKSTTSDQELYMQIYNYELNEFHHPISLTNNGVQDTKPQFVRSKGITYLYWLSGGDIVYMDVTDLIKNHLKKETVQIGSTSKSIYIVDKSDTGVNGYMNTAIKSRTDYPIDDFQIQANGKSEYLLWTDYVISYKNELKAGDPGTEDPRNINKEKQIFAAYREPQTEYASVQVNDFFKDTADYQYVYDDGKGPGTYPVAIRALKDIALEGDATIIAGTTNTIDYNNVVDINGYKGVVEAGDPVIQKKYAKCDGYNWSRPVQLTHEAGANYSDISFAVNNNDDVRAVYVKYQQILNGENSFVEDTSGRTFASSLFNMAGSLKDDGITYSTELPLSGSTLNFSVKVGNTGAKPLAGLKYQFYMTQDGQELISSEAHDIADSNGEKLIPGGETVKLYGTFAMPENITGIAIGLKVLDKDGQMLLDTNKPVRAEAVPDITVLNSSLADKDTAVLSLYISNSGNVKYDGKLDISEKTNGKNLKSLDLSLEAGESKSMDIELEADGSMFGEAETNSDGSVSDKISLKLTAGSYSKDADIKRTAEKSVVDSVKNVKSFSISQSNITLQKGAICKLNTVTTLNSPIPENTADPMQVKWKTSNADVVAILPDGTIAGLSDGSAVITATLLPDIITTATLDDGSLARIDSSYTLPESMIQERSVTVTVGNTSPGRQDAWQSGAINQTEAEQSIILEMKPQTDGQTSIIKPEESAIAGALQKLTEDNKSALVLKSMSDKNIEASKLVITSNVLSSIAGSKVSQVAFETPLNRISLERETIDLLEELAAQQGGSEDITIVCTRRSLESYPDELKKLIGNRPVFDFAIMVGDKNLRDITSTPAALALELYDMPAEASSVDADQIVGAYITEDGKYELIPLSALKDGKLVIRTSHNSMYGGLYNHVQFDDVSGWAKDYVEFLSARGVINGKGNNKFFPGNNITRAEFVKIIAAVAGADTSKFVKSSFRDVAASSWYAPYVEWAYTEGLISGTGNGMFAPNKNITREDMAVVIRKFADKLGYKLPELYMENTFSDYSRMSGYAAPSIRVIQKAGIMDGKSDGLFAPKDYSTRGEVAKVVTKLIKLIVG
jgi:hypothetical protein